MPSSAASKAGLRCGAVTTTATLVSLISNSPQAVNHRDAADRMGTRDFGADLGHHPQRHGLVTFVFEIARRPALGVVARYAFEINECTVLAAQELAGDGCAINGIACESEEISRRIGDLMSDSRSLRLQGAGAPLRHLRPRAPRAKKTVGSEPARYLPPFRGAAENGRSSARKPSPGCRHRECPGCPRGAPPRHELPQKTRLECALCT